jgi:hypothetical protein
MFSMLSLLLACVLPPAQAEGSPVPWLDWVTEELSFAMEAADEPGGAAPDGTDDSRRVGVDLIRLSRELQDLRVEVRQLQDTLDAFIAEVARPLYKENEQLRAELQRLHQALGGDSSALFPNVPRPGGALVADVLAEAAGRPPAAQEPATGTISTPAGRPEAPAFSYSVVSEWGRDPDSEAVLMDGMQSLKGMVLVVPRGSHREDVIELGRDLRRELADYDNINIEIFDEPMAARSFAETSVSSGPQHRVLSISRHQPSGRDTIVYIENGVAREVPLE